MPFCAPQIVAVVTLTSQTGPISQTLFTPSSVGLFRLTVSTKSSAVGPGELEADITLTEPDTGTTNSATVNNAGNFPFCDTNSITDQSGSSPIVLTTSFHPSGETFTYDVTAVVEQLA